MRFLALLAAIELADQVAMAVIIIGGYYVFTGCWPWE